MGNRPEERTIYLTFDDGPSIQTERILNILDQYNVPATFFVVGKEDPLSHHLYQRIVNEGHSLGNHTYSHDYETIYQSPRAFLRDVVKLQERLESITGFRPDIFRFPAGSNTRIHRRFQSDHPHLMIEIMLALRKKGMHHFDWNAGSSDAAAISVDTEQIVNSTFRSVGSQSHAIILFHDSSSKATTVEALPTIIEHFQSRGYTFDRLTPDSFYVRFRHLGF